MWFARRVAWHRGCAVLFCCRCIVLFMFSLISFNDENMSAMTLHSTSTLLRLEHIEGICWYSAHDFIGVSIVFNLKL